MEKYIRVADIGKVCDPGRDWGVKQFTAQEIADSIHKHGRWEFNSKTRKYRCSVCKKDETVTPWGKPSFDYCPNCGAKMDEVENESEWQGKYCIECANSSTCHGAGLGKPACKSFKPRVRYANCEETNGEY